MISIAAIALNILAFGLVSTFPGWHIEVDDDGLETEVKPFPSKVRSRGALALMMISTICVLISVLWQHIAAVAAAGSISTALGGAASNHVGATSMGLGWAGVGVTVIATLGIAIYVLAMQLFDRTID